MSDRRSALEVHQAREVRLLWIVALLVACEMPGGTTNPDVITLSHPEAAVADARRLILERARQSPDPTIHLALKGDDVPPSLRFPELRFAYVTADHVDLITHHDPDHNDGLRIWSAGATRQRHDKPTKYRDVFWFEYDNDAPKTPDNLP